MVKEVSHTFWCETSFLLYRGLFTFAAALVTAVALRFSVGYEDGIAAVTHPQWGLIFCHHEAEHHLQTDQQRMEIPHDGGFVQQCDSVGGRNAAEGRNALRHQFLFIHIKGIAMLIEILAQSHFLCDAGFRS